MHRSWRTGAGSRRRAGRRARWARRAGVGLIGIAALVASAAAASASRTPSGVALPGAALSAAAAMAEVPALGAHLAGPAVTISVPAPPVIAGTPYSSTVSISPYTTTLGSAPALSGCYRLTATGLPAGIELRRRLLCVSGSSADVLSTSLQGTYRAPPHAVLMAASVSIAVQRAGSASGGVLGEASFALDVLPPSAKPSAPEKYAGTSISYVSCPATDACWVLGASSNPVSAPSGLLGHAARFVEVTGRTSAQHLRVPEGGGFLAQLVSVTPLRLRFVRTGLAEPLDALVCPSAGTCVALGSDGGQPARPLALVMTSSGGQFSALRARLPTAASAVYHALSCPTTDSCLAVGTLTPAKGSAVGFAQRIGLDGSTARLGPLVQTSLVDDLAGVSCVDTSSCLATGALGGGPTGNGRILISHDGGASWSKDQLAEPDPLCRALPGHPCPKALQPWFQLVTMRLGFGEIGGIGCAAGVRYSCAVVWNSWSAIADTTDARLWHVGTLTAAPANLGYGNYASIAPSLSCPQPGRCFAVEAPLVVCGPDFACTHTAVLESIPHADTGLTDAPLGDGWEWGLAGYGPPGTQQPALTAISCPSVTTCVAVGHWQPDAPSGWGATFPLVIAPQSPLRPYFAPTTNGAWTFLTTMAPVALGAGALVLSAVGGAPVVVAVIGFTGTLAGASECAHGQALGCVSAALGGSGLALEALGLTGAGLAAADGGGSVQFIQPPGDFLITGGDGSTYGVAILPDGATASEGEPGLGLGIEATGNVVNAADPGWPKGGDGPAPPSWLTSPQEPEAGSRDE